MTVKAREPLSYVVFSVGKGSKQISFNFQRNLRYFLKFKCLVKLYRLFLYFQTLQQSLVFSCFESVHLDKKLFRNIFLQTKHTIFLNVVFESFLSEVRIFYCYHFCKNTICHFKMDLVAYF